MDRRPLGRGPDADDGIRRALAVDRLAVLRHVLLGDLQHDRVDVVARQVVLAAALVAEADAQVDGVERRAEIDEEGVVDLPGERQAPAGNALDRLGGDRVVVGDRLRPDVVRRDRRVGQQRLGVDELALRVVGLALERVELLDVELRIGDRAHARQRVQERVRVADLGPELPLVADVVVAVARVVDVDVVRRPRVEAVEVRPAGRILERDPVGDDRQRILRIIGRVRVEVGVVGRRVDRRERRLAMARS